LAAVSTLEEIFAVIVWRIKSQRPSVKVLNRNASQVDFFEAANIDRGDPISFWIDAFSVRMNAARPAKAVLDDLLVERVRADVLIRCKQPQPVPGNKPQKRSFA
jgi:hypothetical protein